MENFYCQQKCGETIKSLLKNAGIAHAEQVAALVTESQVYKEYAHIEDDGFTASAEIFFEYECIETRAATHFQPAEFEEHFILDDATEVQFMILDTIVKVDDNLMAVYLNALEKRLNELGE